LTLMISRQQEYRSDEIACRVAGSEVFIEVLRELLKSQAGFNPYVQSVVQPLLSHGYQPHIAQDFATFFSAPQNQKATSDALEKELETRRPEPFDSHPPLALRIERASSLGFTAAKCSDEPALSLFANLREWEANIIRRFVPDLKEANLKPVNWESAAAEIYLPLWRKQVESFLPLLVDTTILALPAAAKNLAPLADKVLHPPGRILSRSQREAQALSALGCAFGLSLVDHGWTFVAAPGSVAIQRGSTAVKPPALMSALQSGAMSADQWRAFCAEKGIGDYPLVQSTPVAQAEPARA
jgi:heat shock protein HtpX